MSSPEQTGTGTAENSSGEQARLENTVLMYEAYADLAEAMNSLAGVNVKLADLAEGEDEILAATGGCEDALARLERIDLDLADIGRVLENRLLRARLAELENEQ